MKRVTMAVLAATMALMALVPLFESMSPPVAPVPVTRVVPQQIPMP